MSLEDARRADAFEFERNIGFIRRGVLRGSPLAEVRDGRATFDVVLRGTNRAGTFPILAQVGLAGVHDLVRYAAVSAWHGGGDDVYEAWDVSYADADRQFPGHDVGGDVLTAFAGRLLGAHPPSHEWDRYWNPEQDFLVGTDSPLMPALRLTGCPIPIARLGPGPWTETRDRIEAALRARYAFLNGRFLVRTTEPVWRVIGRDTGRVVVSAEHHMSYYTSVEPVAADFPFDRKADAMAFAVRVAAGHPKGKVVVKGDGELFVANRVRIRDGLGCLASMAVALADVGTKHMSTLLGAEAVASLERLRFDVLANVADRRPFERDWEACRRVVVLPGWGPAWKAARECTTRSLAKRLALADPRDLGFDKWIVRFRMMLAAVEALADAKANVLGPLESPEDEGFVESLVEPPRTYALASREPGGTLAALAGGRTNLPSPWTCGRDALGALDGILADMEALQRLGGPAFSAAWKRAVTALSLSRERGPTTVTRDALRGLVEATPEAFDSGHLAAKWAMDWRPALRDCLDGGTTTVVAVRRVDGRCRRSLVYGASASG